MNSKDILYSKGNNDECYTPRYAVLPLLEFMEDKKDKIIWCPFDTEDSEFVKVFKEKGFNVINSHITSGEDFFEYEPKEWDIIISNPPFTNKRKFFERALSFNKPFCLLMTLVWLNDSAPKQIFKDKDMELLMFFDRICFNGNGKGLRPTFSSAYYCYNFLPKQIIIRGFKYE
mgnify:CR=1 FL=1